MTELELVIRQVVAQADIFETGEPATVMQREWLRQLSSDLEPETREAVENCTLMSSVRAEVLITLLEGREP